MLYYLGFDMSSKRDIYLYIYKNTGFCIYVIIDVLTYRLNVIFMGRPTCIFVNCIYVKKSFCIGLYMCYNLGFEVSTKHDIYGITFFYMKKILYRL